MRYAPWKVNLPHYEILRFSHFLFYCILNLSFVPLSSPLNIMFLKASSVIIFLKKRLNALSLLHTLKKEAVRSANKRWACEKKVKSPVNRKLLIDKKLSYRRETARQLPTWREGG